MKRVALGLLDFEDCAKPKHQFGHDILLVSMLHAFAHGLHIPFTASTIFYTKRKYISSAIMFTQVTFATIKVSTGYSRSRARDALDTRID